MRINGIRCDGCGKEHLFEPFYMAQSFASGIPDEWFLVSQGEDDRQQPWLFCSKECLRAHPLTRLPEEGKA